MNSYADLYVCLCAIMTHFYTSLLSSGAYEICKIVVCSIFTIFIQLTFCNPSKGIINTHKLPTVRVCVYLHNLLPTHTATHINISLCSKIINSSVFVVMTCFYFYCFVIGNPWRHTKVLIRKVYLHIWKAEMATLCGCWKLNEIYTKMFTFSCVYLFIYFSVRNVACGNLICHGIICMLSIVSFYDIYLLDRC